MSNFHTNLLGRQIWYIAPDGDELVEVKVGEVVGVYFDSTNEQQAGENYEMYLDRSLTLLLLLDDWGLEWFSDYESTYRSDYGKLAWSVAERDSHMELYAARWTTAHP